VTSIGFPVGFWFPPTNHHLLQIISYLLLAPQKFIWPLHSTRTQNPEQNGNLDNQEICDSMMTSANVICYYAILIFMCSTNNEKLVKDAEDIP
jgi:hypothetical protein